VIERDVPLAARTTLRLGGAARLFTEVASDAELIAALRWAQERGERVALLGGGSNLVVPDAGFDGLVIALAQRGLRHEVRGSVVRLTAAAGEPWDGLVAFAVERDLAGLECLSGIPGLCGATPIQNVGAYGQEVSQCIERVRVLDRTTLSVRELGSDECGFGYRDSAFKRNPERCVVLEVSFALRLGGEPLVAYDELRRALAGRATPSLQEVRAVVLSLRRAKGMLIEPDATHGAAPGSAGSFFLNPVVGAAQADAIARAVVVFGGLARAQDMPRYAAGPAAPAGAVKLAAGWLIERAGYVKGERRGAVGLSPHHALALVHHGSGTTAELLALAEEIRARVKERFGVELQREPVLLGS
jgi:UDP-N-acetylmuramate dehydrogenase